MKSERVVLLTSPEFKAYLSTEARREGVSVAELVRNRCESPRANQEELALRELTAELGRAVATANKALRAGLAEADGVLRELRAGRASTSRTPARARKAA